MATPKRKSISRSAGKADFLRKSGALNPRPGGVKDEQFAGTDRFFDVRDLVQVKYEMLRRVQKDGWSVSQAAKLFGFSRPSFYEAKESLEKEGLPGLLPRTRGPKGPHKLTEEALEYLESELSADPPKSPQELEKVLVDRFKIQVHPRSIGRALDRWKKKSPNQGGGKSE